MQRQKLKIKSKDHPRLRGEKSPDTVSKTVSLGSPPLARGKDGVVREMTPEERITPACAGKRGLCASRKISKRDHPRLRGEKSTYQNGACSNSGSPPLARGKADTIADICQPVMDHPRLRGEKISPIKYFSFISGSPPLARGKVSPYQIYQ